MGMTRTSSSTRYHMASAAQVRILPLSHFIFAFCRSRRSKSAAPGNLLLSLSSLFNARSTTLLSKGSGFWDGCCNEDENQGNVYWNTTGLWQPFCMYVVCTWRRASALSMNHQTPSVLQYISRQCCTECKPLAGSSTTPCSDPPDV